MASFTQLLDRAFHVGGVRPELQVKVGGDNEALQVLKMLPDAIALRILRAALKAAQAPGLAAAKAAAQAIRTRHGRRDRPHLDETVFSKIKRKKEQITGTIGYTGSAGWLVEHGHRMVTGGTVARINKLFRNYGRADRARQQKNTGRGRVVGQVPPHPFLAPAMAIAEAEMTAVFLREVRQRTERALARIAKQQQ